MNSPASGAGIARGGQPVPDDSHPPGDDDPWADLHEPDPVPPGSDADPWSDPSALPWRDAPDPSGGLPPTEVGVWQAGSTVPPVYAAVPPDEFGGEPTQLHEPWADGALIEPGAEGPRRGLPGWAWVASVVLLGTLLGVGAYVVVDKADDGSVRTDDSTSTSSSTSSTTTSTTTTTAPTTTTPPTTVPIVPATPPATAPDTGPPTVPGAVTTPSTFAPTTVATTPAPTTAPPTTPAPTTAAPTTTTAPPATAPPTTPAPTAPPADGTVPGDLGIPGVPMSQPPCDGQYVTFLASVKNTTGPAMQEALESFPGSHYLRTDQTCPSLNSPASDGTPLYRIYAGPYADVAEACAARSMSTQGAFVKRLSTTDSPAHIVTCP